MHREVYEHFTNNMPPVDSPIIIQVHGHHRYVTAEGLLILDYADDPVQVQVSRPAHIERKGDDMQYQAKDGSMYLGRFPWTHK